MAPRGVRPSGLGEGREHPHDLPDCYLDLPCAQVRRFGRTEPTVLTALLRYVAAQPRDDQQRRAVADQCALALHDMSPDLLASDQDGVRDRARRVGLALSGQVDDACRDRAGETRSV